MDPMLWLREIVPEFGELQKEELEAIANFALLWSLFEGRNLRGARVADALRPLVDRWVAEHRLDAGLFTEPLAYFRHRYFESNEAAERFNALNNAPGTSIW